MSKFLRWLIDAIGQHILGKILGSGLVIGAVNYFVRAGKVPPSWEASWFIWTASAFGGFLLSAWVLPHLLPSNPPISQPPTQPIAVSPPISAQNAKLEIVFGTTGPYRRTH